MAEFAISLVVLIILLAGIIDLGRAMFTYMALRDAAQEGAVFGSVNPTDVSAIATRVEGSSNMLISLASQTPKPIATSVNLIGMPCTGNGIEVIVMYNNFPLTMPFLGALVGSQTVPISARASDTILSPACQ